MISNTTDLSDREVVSHQEWLKASADFSREGEGTRKSMRGLSAFAMEDGIVYHRYLVHLRGPSGVLGAERLSSARFGLGGLAD